MQNAESTADITMFWLEQFSIVFVLNFYFLNISFGKASDRTLHIKHAQKPGALKWFKNEIIICFSELFFDSCSDVLRNTFTPPPPLKIHQRWSFLKNL